MVSPIHRDSYSWGLLFMGTPIHGDPYSSDIVAGMVDGRVVEFGSRVGRRNFNAIKPSSTAAESIPITSQRPDRPSCSLVAMK